MITDYKITTQEFVRTFNLLKEYQTQAMRDKGFGHDNDGEKLMLIVTELGEAMESLRHGDPPSDHIPEFRGSEEELADAIIRILHFAGARGLKVGEAVIAKMIYNESRPHKHGKKF